MAFSYDPNQQGQFPQDNGNGLHQDGPQGINPQQPIQQGVQENGSPAAFVQQQGGVDGNGGSVAGDAKTTLWMGELEPWIDENFIRSVWFGMGETVNSRWDSPGFAQFVQRHAAEMAINQMQGYPIGNSRVRLSWGRSQNNSGPAGTPYRPAPPPPQYNTMGMPPAQHYAQYQ